MIKKTYIPGKPRNPKLTQTTGTSGVSKTEFNNVAGSSHEHYNKGVLDQITEAMLIGAVREMITSNDTETELTDENILSALRVLSEISKANADLLEDIKSKFLSKIEPDTAQKLIKFVEGLEIGDYTTGALGAGAAIKMLDGTSYAEVDNLTVRQKATFRELIIESLKHIGGQLVLTPARMKCVRVVDGGTYYKCYFDTGDGEVSNEFVAGDFARCQVFTGSGTKFYWRLVTLVGEDWINLSKTSAAVGSDAPEAGDDITQLGNATDTERQSAIILSTVGIDAPSWKQYSGINSFSLEGKETTVFSKLGNRISGETVFTSGGANLDDHLDGVAQDILDALQAAQDAEDKAQQAIEDAEADVATINTEIGRLQDQIDGKVSNWYYAYSPTLSNYPASDWTTNEIKDAHIGDTFTNTEPAPAENAGKSWKFVKDGSTYSWIVISDSDAIKALLEASKAQATADGKSTTHLFQPTKYKLGDMWLLNADQTVNGTLYKQGELLTATQDSETFVQAHWLKRIRYTDDTAIDNLVIGGRNLVIKTGSLEGYYLDGVWMPNNAALTPKDFIKVVPGGTYTMSIPISAYVDNVVRMAMWDGNKDFVVRGNYGGGNQSQPIRIHTITIPNSVHYVTPGYGKDINIKLEKGNKATDWTEAPEDVQANIATAKQEALTAAGNAQTTANSLKNFTDVAFTDGVVDRAEAKAIEKYKNTLNETMAKTEATYNKVFYSNTYLEGTAKTDLLNAKINLWGQRDTLLSAINTAIAGGTTTPAQKTSVDNAFSTFNNLMTAFQNALEEANKAIQVKLDNISKGYVNDLEIGSRNYWRRSYLPTTLSGTTQSYLNSNNGFDILVGTSNNGEGNARRSGVITSNGRWILSGYIKTNVLSGSKANFFDFCDIPVQGTVTYNSTDWTYFEVKANVTNYSSTYNFIDFMFPVGWAYWYFKDIKLEKGNKATDWTPAPEDVDKKISDVDAKAADAQAKANKSAAITDEFSGFNGGLATAVIMEMREPSTTTRGDATAGISGIQGAAKDEPAIWAGGTYQQALSNSAKAIIRHDGTSKFTDTDITGVINATSGTIGSMHLQDNMLVSSNGKLSIDGANSTITLKDASTDDVKILIKPNNLPTSPAAFFGSTTKSASLTPIKGTISIDGNTLSSNTIEVGVDEAYTFNIPSITLTAYVGVPNIDVNIIPASATAYLYLTNGNIDMSIGVAYATSFSGSNNEVRVFPATTITVPSSGNWRLQLRFRLLSGGFNSSEVNGYVKLESSASTYSAVPLVNRSELGANGIVIATDSQNYTYSVGGLFQVRRGNVYFRVTSSGIEKSTNGTNWTSL